jgi:hypothetical protein
MWYVHVHVKQSNKCDTWAIVKSINIGTGVGNFYERTNECLTPYIINFRKQKVFYFIQLLLVTFLHIVINLVVIGFEVLTEAVMESSMFWDIMPCSPLLATCFCAGFLLGLSFDTEDGGYIFLKNFGWLSSGLHSVIFQKIELFNIFIVCCFCRRNFSVDFYQKFSALAPIFNFLSLRVVTSEILHLIIWYFLRRHATSIIGM